MSIGEILDNEVFTDVDWIYYISNVEENEQPEYFESGPGFDGNY